MVARGQRYWRLSDLISIFGIAAPKMGMDWKDDIERKENVAPCPTQVSPRVTGRVALAV